MIGTGHWQPSSRCPTCCPRFCWPCDSWANYVCRKPSELRGFFLAILHKDSGSPGRFWDATLFATFLTCQVWKYKDHKDYHETSVYIISSNIFHLMTHDLQNDRGFTKLCPWTEAAGCWGNFAEVGWIHVPGLLMSMDMCGRGQNVQNELRY